MPNRVRIFCVPRVGITALGLLSFLLLSLQIGNFDVRANPQKDPQDSSNSSPKSVVLLYSYGDGIPAYQQATRGFLSAMREGGVSVNNLFFEYLDLERKKDAEHYTHLTTLFRHKYEGKKIDLVVTVHSGAMKFILNQGKELFPGTPVVSYLAPDAFETAGVDRRFLLLPMKMDFQGTLELALKLFPKTTRVFFINGVGEGERRLQLEAENVFAEWRDRLQFEYTHDLSLEEILQRVAALPPRTLVLYSNVFRDKTGRTFVPMDVAEMVARSANAPVFGMYNTLLEKGIVGGSVFNFELEGARAGTAALDILKGNLSLAKPVTILSASRIPMFDWQQLKRWGVHESQFPEETIFVNRTISLWAQYRTYVIGVVLLMLIQSVLIAGLLVQKRRRSSAEERLRQKTMELNQFFNVTLELLCIADTNGTFLLLNPAWERVLGYSREELMGRRFLDFVHPEDQAATLEAVSTLASQKEVHRFQNRYRCKDGSYRWLEWSSTPAEQVIYAAARDITGHKTAEAQMKELLLFEELLADVSARFVNLPADQMDRVIDDAQRRVCRRLGLDYSALWEFSIEHPDVSTLTHIHRPPGGPPFPDRMEAQEYFPWCLQQIRAGKVIALCTEEFPEEAVRDREVHRHYGIKFFLVFPLTAGGESPIGALGFATMREERVWLETDIKKLQLLAQVFANALTRKRADLDLREREARLSLTTDAAGAGLWIMEINTGGVWVSAKARELFHFSPDEKLTYESFFQVIHPDDHERVRQSVQETLQSGEPLLSEYRIVLPDGSIRWISASGQRYPSTEPVRVMGVSFDITDRKRAEETLAESQAQLLALFNSTNDMIWSVDPETFGLLTFNSGLRDYFFDRRGMEIRAGMTPDELFPGLPEFAVRWRGFYTRALRDGSYATEYLAAAGTNHLLLSFSPMRHDGEVFGISVFGKDITALKHAEQALGERLQFELFLSDLAGRAATLSSDGTAGEISGALERILEFFEADRVGLLTLSRERTSWEIGFAAMAKGIPPLPLRTKMERSLFPWIFDKIVTRRETISVSAVEDLPREADVDKQSLREWGIRAALIIPIARGENVGCLTITAERNQREWPEPYVARLRLIGNVLFAAVDRVDFEKELRKAADEWQATFDSIPDVVMILDRDLRILRHNGATVSFFGRPPQEIQGQHCHQLMYGSKEPPMDCPVKRTLFTGDHQEIEWYDARRNAWYLLSSGPMIDREGQITQVVYRIKDITLQKRVELETSAVRRKLQQSDRLLRMGELTASLAHELNQPLTSILSNARAALRFIQSDRYDVEEIKEILQDIADDDKRAGEIIRSLRSMFRREEGERELVSLNLLLREVVALFKSEAVIRNLRLEMEFTDPLPLVHVARVQVQQVLINILMNAAESVADTSGDRKITARTRQSDNDYVQVAVCDNGSGIAEEDLGQIFNTFFTKKQKGLGLGLSICKSIIQAHEGRIWVENNPDKGTTFFFELPVAGRQ